MPTPTSLAPETKKMENMRREMEQDGHRRWGQRVNARYRQDEPSSTPAPEGELQNSILQNPWLNNQRYDGIDPNLNPEPPLNTEARREMDNELRLQHQKKLEKQNAPSMSAAPKPRPQ